MLSEGSNECLKCVYNVTVMGNSRYNIKLMEPSFEPWSPVKGTDRQVAVLMSGGVDSSVTAHLLGEAGWDVVGITMKIPVSCETFSRGCCGVDAALVCHEMGIAHYFVDVAEAFEGLIIERFRESYAAGLTPNPCADCNTFLKFSLVWDLIEEAFGIKHVATGHYARVVETEGGARLGRCKDKSKDQSYFVYGIGRERLGRFVLPLGEYTKAEVRAIAEKLGLSVAQKPESMELCFAGEADYRNVLDDAQSNRPGDLTDMAGKRIGEHKGISNYTLGQRRGLGFAGGKPLYAGRIDAGTNTVALGTREEVGRRVIRADEINLLIADGLCEGALLYGKIRSYGDPSPCRVAAVSESEVTVEFDEPQFAPSPGQKLVLYDNSDYVVAGGTITGNQQDETQ